MDPRKLIEEDVHVDHLGSTLVWLGNAARIGVDAWRLLQAPDSFSIFYSRGKDTTCCIS